MASIAASSTSAVLELATAFEGTTALGLGLGRGRGGMVVTSAHRKWTRRKQSSSNASRKVDHLNNNDKETHRLKMCQSH